MQSRTAPRGTVRFCLSRGKNMVYWAAEGRVSAVPEKLRGFWGRMRFRKKVIALFAMMLFCIMGFALFEQITVMNRVRFADEQDNLRMLSEQVGINFSDQLSEDAMQLYTSMALYGVPSLVRAQNAQEDTASLHLALAQMLYSTSPFDFVMIRTTGGMRVSANNTPGVYSSISAEAMGLLEASSECGYGILEWYRGSDGDIYLIRDIYDISPLVYCGRIIAHVKDSSGFRIGEQRQALEYTFLFYAAEDHLLYVDGTLDSVPYDTLPELQAAMKNGRLTIDGSTYFASVSKVEMGYAVGLTPLSRVERSNMDVARMMLLYSLVGLVVGIALLAVCLRPLMRQLDIVSSSMDAVAQGHLDARAQVVSRDDIGQLALHFNDMAGQIGVLMHRVAAEQKLKTEAQFKALEYHYRSLQTQLSPHFIFNALETINAMAKIDGSSDLSRNIVLLSHYFRLVTTNMQREFITAENEIAGLRDYAEIHQNIHGSRLTVTFACAEEVRGAVLPVMIVQPILENALVHGVNSAEVGSRIDVVFAAAAPHRLQITVTDNGPGAPEALLRGRMTDPAPDTRAHTGVGLKNVRERLELLYGSDAQIEVRSGAGGTCVTVTLPLDFTPPLQLDSENPIY